VLIFGLAVLGFAGCRTYSDSMFSAIETPDLRAMAYATNIIQEGDVVSITFQYTTNFNAVQKVALDGTLSLDKLGQVKAAGSTVGQLHDELARLYKPYSKQDTLTVKLAGALTSVYVTGAVVRPGRVTMERPMTALEAIMETGGFDPFRAKITRVVVLRLESGVQRTHRINIKRAMRGDDGKPFYLQPFDIVFVPAKTFNF
jgi:polysaccharide export outer membrane protein